MQAKNLRIYLAQTDTTAGFLSKDKTALNKLKNRALHKPCLITTAQFCELKDFVRVPQSFKNLVRKAKKTSFIYPNGKALRVVLESKHRNFLLKNGWFYSSSANAHRKDFDELWAKKVIKENQGIIVDKKLSQNKASKLIKLGRSKKRKIR